MCLPVYTTISTVASIPSLISLSDTKVQYWSGSKKKYHLQVPWDQSDVFKPTNMSHYCLINAFTNNSTISVTIYWRFQHRNDKKPSKMSLFWLGFRMRSSCNSRSQTQSTSIHPTCRPQATHLSAATNKDTCNTNGFHHPLIRFPLFMYETQMTSEEALLVSCVGHHREWLLIMTICVTFTSCIPLA